MDTQGDENALGFSLNFDPGQLQFVSAAAGGGAATASLNVNSAQAASGRIGVALALPTGNTFGAGTVAMLTVNFTAIGAGGPVTVSFGDQPIAREIVNVNVEDLTATYADGTVTVQGGSSGNHPPVMSAIPDQTLNQGANLTASFTVSDSETPAALLTVTATSRNQALVPDSNLFAGGSGADRTLVAIPVAGQVGTAIIALTVSDGDLAVTNTFSLTVLGGQQAPVLSVIENQILVAGVTGPPIPFVVTDADTPGDKISVTASSSNQALLPGDNLAVIGTGNNRTLSIRTVAGLTGSVIIALTARDKDGNEGSRQFVLTITSSNGKPSISPVADQISVDSAPVSIAFTVGDFETAPAQLVVQASSSNQAVLSNSGIQLGGSGESRTLTLTPVANQLGASTVTLTVRDEGGLTASTSFQLTVKSNTPPVIAAVPDQVASQGVLEIPLTIGDSESPADQLTLSAASTVTSLIPVASIVFSGNGPNRLATITPAARRSGVSRLTITVKDPQGASAETSFDVSVTAVNTPPEISGIADVTVNEDTATADIGFLVSDQETPAGALVVSGHAVNTNLVTAASFTFGGTGISRTVRVLPATNQFGSTLVTISVSDGASITSTNFTLTVLPVIDPPLISPIADQTTTIGTPTPSIGFTIGDPETPAEELKLTVVSSDPVLIPPGNIVFGGGGSNRTVVVTPASGKTGAAAITITLADLGGLVATTSFKVVVVGPPPNQPPQVQLVAPTNGAVIFASAPVTVEAEASDSDGQVAQVELLADGSRLAVLTTPPYRFAWASAAVGTHVLTAIATDDAGATNVSAGVIIQVTAPRPANDDFANRAFLTDNAATVAATNQNATVQPGEPNHAGKPGGASLWWSWTAQVSGPVTVSTLGSSIDTLLAVYTGSSLTNLQVVAANDDDPDGGSTSRLSFIAVAGTQYSIAVDSFGGATGVIQLNLQATQPAGPALKAEISGKNIILSWPTNATGYVVEGSSDLTPNGWTSIGQNPVVAGDQYSLKVNAATGNRFFRLHRP